MGNITKAIIALIAGGIYVFLLFNGLYDNKIAFFIASLVLVGVAWFIMRKE